MPHVTAIRSDLRTSITVFDVHSYPLAGRPKKAFWMSLAVGTFRSFSILATVPGDLPETTSSAIQTVSSRYTG